MNVIYAYKKRSSGKIVYVGQTCNLDERHRAHTEYDPFNVNTREYDYPLSRGIRKYGQDEYELIILEDNIPKDELNARERYWIRYYDTCFNGYNQTLGGASPSTPKLNEQVIDQIIELLRNSDYTFEEIAAKTQTSLTHVYNVNIGARRHRDELEYPIRSVRSKGTKGLKFSPEECLEIHEEILKQDKSYKEIAQLFGCSADAISDISRGKTKAYRYDDLYVYPLRTPAKSISIGKKNYWKNKKACIDYPDKGSKAAIGTQSETVAITHE